MQHADASADLQYSASPSFGSFGSQILVGHFPGVVEGVKGGVPNKVPQRPLAGHLAFGMERSNRIAIGIAISVQFLAVQHRLLRRDHAYHFRPVPLRENHVTDDAISISPSAARTLLHLS